MLAETKILHWLYQTRIRNIVLFYLGVNLFFGIIYYMVSVNFSPNHVLIGMDGLVAVDTSFYGFLNAIYYSFVTSSSLGFGDIVPLGFLRFISILDVVMGWALLSFVVTKLVAKRQEAMIQHIYHTSFEEKSRNLRASFYLLRDNIDHLIEKIEDKKIAKHELSDALSLHLMSFYTSISELYQLFKKYAHIRELDEEKLILHLLLCLKSFLNLLGAIEKKKCPLNKKEVIIHHELIEILQKIFGLLKDHDRNILLSGYRKRLRVKIAALKKWTEKMFG